MTSSLRPPPEGDRLTADDRLLAPRYFRLFDAEAAGIDWEIAARDILDLDPALPDANALWRRYRDRAQWMVEVGWRQLMAPGTPDPIGRRSGFP